MAICLNPSSTILPDVRSQVNLGGILAWEFLLMHWVEVRRWQDIRKPGSVNEDPIFKGNKVPNPETGYPGALPLALQSLQSCHVDMSSPPKAGRRGISSMHDVLMSEVMPAQAASSTPLASPRVTSRWEPAPCIPCALCQDVCSGGPFLRGDC